jgi:ribonucleoside-diphosphate reductase alpha chain
MRVMDPAWIGMKLRKLLDYPEPLGDFMAFAPGTRKQQNWPSTVAYIARLIMHRYAMLGILDENGYPTREMGILESPARSQGAEDHAGLPVQGECGNYDGDPQGRLRLLQRLRGGGGLRVDPSG